RVAAADGSFLLDNPPPTTPAEVSDDARYVAAGVERDLDVVVAAAVGHQANRAAGREDGERVALDLEHVRDLPEQRHGNRVQKRFEPKRRLVVTFPPLGGVTPPALDRFADASANVRNLHKQQARSAK